MERNADGFEFALAVKEARFSPGSFVMPTRSVSRCGWNASNGIPRSLSTGVMASW